MHKFRWLILGLLLLAVPSLAQGAVLPAPLYWLSEDDGQLWRLETDAVTTQQITHFPTWISHFDISPVDGSFVILTNNDLIVVDAAGGKQQTLIDGPQPPGQGLTPEVIQPPVLWSPHGTQIAYAQGGIRVLDVATGESQLLLADVYPSERIHPSEVYFYATLHWVRAWSPDGSQLMIDQRHPPTRFTLFALDIASGNLQELFTTERGEFGVGGLTLSPDGKRVWHSVTNYPPILVEAMDRSLIQIDTATGQQQIVIPGVQDGLRYSAIGAQALEDGKLYVFLGTQDAAQEPNGSQVEFNMFRVDPIDPTLMESLREDSFRLAGGVLWANDGSGAVTRVCEGDMMTCNLTWIPVGNTAPVPLPISAYHLEWGN